MTDDAVIPQDRAGRSMMIRNLVPGLTERGKIKIGRKGPERESQGGKKFRIPQKLDHFLITTLERDGEDNFVVDKEIHEKLGDKKAAGLHRIPVFLLYNEPWLNFQTRYAAFKGRQLWCSGDGDKAQRLTQNGGHDCVECPCERQDPTYRGSDKCKINGTLSVILGGVDTVGGVWKFRTTSYNSVVGITSSLALIRSVTGGILAGIPLVLTVGPKTVVSPVDQKTQTVYVVSLEFDGSLEQLRDLGYKSALDLSSHHVRIDQIEDEARRLLTPPKDRVFADDPEDVAEEFYPEDEEAPAGAAAGKPTRSQTRKGKDTEAAAEEEAASDEAAEDQAAEEQAAAEEEAAAAAAANGGDAELVYVFIDTEGEEHECSHCGKFADKVEKAIRASKDAAELSLIGQNNAAMMKQLENDPKARTKATDDEPEAIWAEEIRTVYREMQEKFAPAEDEAPKGRQPAEPEGRQPSRV